MEHSDSLSALAARKLRDAEPQDEVWVRDRKTPLIIQTRDEKDDEIVFNATGNGYDYVISVDPDRPYGKCVRASTRDADSTDLTDDIQGVRHIQE